MEQRRVDSQNTAYGDLEGWALHIPERGWTIIVSAEEYPALPLHQAPSGGPVAGTVEESVAQFRAASHRS